MKPFVKEDIDVVLAAREYWYGLFHGTFGGEPSDELMAAFDDGVSCGLFDLCSDDAAEAFAALKDRFLALDRSEAGLSRLAGEYTRLFVGPGHLEAPPWESPYVGQEELLFQESTLAVRYAYAECGYLPQEYPKVADDHLALMMDFMAHMAKRSVEAFSEQDPNEFKALLEKQVKFIDEHLLDWFFDYADRLDQADASGFYSSAARCALAFFAQDKDSLERIAVGMEAGEL